MLSNERLTYIAIILILILIIYIFNTLIHAKRGAEDVLV